MSWRIPYGMAHTRIRQTPHAFKQRQHWTGRCVVDGCGLPTEHWVNKTDLPIELAPIEEEEPVEPVEPETKAVFYELDEPQLSLF